MIRGILAGILTGIASYGLSNKVNAEPLPMADIVQVTSDGTGYFYPAASSEHIAFSREVHRLYIMDKDGNNERLLVDGQAGGSTVFPGFHPDGQSLLYHVSFGPTGAMKSINIDGTNDHVLLGKPPIFPAYNNDGSKIVFGSGVYENINTINPNGTGNTILTHGTFPSFSFDGTQILFSLDNTGPISGPLIVMDSVMALISYIVD